MSIFNRFKPKIIVTGPEKSVKNTVYVPVAGAGECCRKYAGFTEGIMSDDQNQDEGNKRGRPRNLDVNQALCDKMELDTLLSQLPAGWLVQVHREEPEWCKGYLGKIYCDSDNLNLDSIKSRFGGRILNLRFVDPQNKFRGSKRVIFPEPPRKDSVVIRESDINFGQSHTTESKSGNGPIGQGGFIPPGMPPHLAQQLAAYYAGYPVAPAPPPQPQQSPLDIMQAQQVMNLMNSQMTAQQELMRANMAHMKEMEQIRRESEEERERHRRAMFKDREPMGELQSAISLIRELNGIKSELGSADTTATIIGHAAPIVESAVGEFIELFKLRTQAEIARAQQPRSMSPPLPQRQVAPMLAPKSEPKSGNGHDDPVKLAKDLKRFYEALPSDQQTAVMQAFLEPSDQILDSFSEQPQNTGMGGLEVLSPEDKEILENEDIDIDDQDPEIPDGEHAESTQDDDSSHRSSD
jgi:hypothetical protein